TRDIELAPAIIDLVDNSIDGAKRVRPSEGDDRFDGLSVEMRLDLEGFEILDTCGGFSREHAAKYAFKFGRHPEQKDAPGEVGQSGVGMKRAIFKLGRKFTVASKTNGDSWKVAVDVDEWLSDPEDWTFPIADANGDGLEGPGTLVRCGKLLPSSKSRLGEAAF